MNNVNNYQFSWGSASGINLFKQLTAFWRVTLVLLVVSLVFGFAIQVDERELLDINIWIKPLKFSLSIALYLATFAYFSQWLPRELIASKYFRAYITMICFTVVVEMIWVGGAAYAGLASHFNTTHGLLKIAYPIAGLFAVLLISPTLVFAWYIQQNKQANISPAIKLSIVSSLIITGIATLVVAGYMSNGNGHNVGGIASDANSYAFIGWLKDQGDLRVAHFFATHAMQFIPLFALVTLLLKNPLVAKLTVIAIACLYSLYIAITFAQALDGKPWL